MPIRLLDHQNPWGSFKSRVRFMRRDYPWMFWVNSACVLALGLSERAIAHVVEQFGDHAMADNGAINGKLIQCRTKPNC